MKTVFDPAFMPYGRAIPGVPVDGLMAVVAAFPLPETGMVYSPREDDLHARTEFTPYGEALYADMPYQLGYCAGSNRSAETLVRHGGSAFICGQEDFELVVSLRWLRAPERFALPAHTLVEIYGDTLRSAPLGQGFRILVIQPFATNTEWQGPEGTLSRNTWL